MYTMGWWKGWCTLWDGRRAGVCYGMVGGLVYTMGGFRTWWMRSKTQMACYHWKHQGGRVPTGVVSVHW